MNTITTYCERGHAQRSSSAITEADFKRAHIIESTDFDRGVVAHLAIRNLRIVQIFAVPEKSLEWFSVESRKFPDAFAS